jgi:O-antigen ligase
MPFKTSNQLQHQAPHSIIAYIGIIAAFCFAFSVAMERDLARISEVFLILSLLVSSKNIYRNNTKQDNRLYLLAFIFLIFMILVNKWAEATYASEDLNHERFMRHYIRFFLFLAIGWWLYKSENLVIILFSCLILGFLIRIIESGDFSHWSKVLSGHRMEFGFSNAQHTGIYAGSIIFLTLFLHIKALKAPTFPLKIFLQSLLCSIFIISLICAISSQTRGIFIGLVIALPILFIAWGVRSPIAQRIGVKKTLTVSVIFTICGILLAFQHEPMEKRFQKATQTVSKLAQEGIENTPTTSSGIRLHQWHLALKLIMERPLFGYGGATKEQLIKQSEMPKAAIGNFGHFHNSYLELAVAYGLGAVAIFLFLLYFLFYRLIVALKQKQISPSFAYMGLSWLIFFAIANIFESYVMYRSGYVLFAIIGGAIYGLSIPKRQNNE